MNRLIAALVDQSLDCAPRQSRPLSDLSLRAAERPASGHTLAFSASHLSLTAAERPGVRPACLAPGVSRGVRTPPNSAAGESPSTEAAR